MKENEVLARFVGKLIIKENALLTENREVIQIRMPDGCLNEYPLYSMPAFHLRWELLMPVWYKFKDLKIDIKDGQLAFAIHCTKIEHAILHKGPLPTEACKLLAQAIEWYNANKQL